MEPGHCARFGAHGSRGADHAGEPCRQSGNWCHQAYRWDVDRIENKDGQVANYLYSQEVNYDGLKGSPYLQTPYVSGSWLECIDYGMVTGNASAAANTHQVSFHYEIDASGRRRRARRRPRQRVRTTPTSQQITFVTLGRVLQVLTDLL